MFLKTLTMRGFKSFASATRLELEPGITCVVGPNGSGKSNVVDALAWVMGEQGVKNLRGGKMDDVIFAGTAKRQGLGRAEVTLTIDNTDGAIPIDYTEVTISRTLFKSGSSEYAVNGAPARLLDIQELLNDSGLGKEMHVIVGQGRLDAILHADPMERRGFIEEAAGVLKHRRRKDKALRKLDGLQTNLDRLLDLRQELARQLGPLGRQARAAQRAATVQATLRDVTARLLADDLVRAQAQFAAQPSEVDLQEDIVATEAHLADVTAALTQAEAQAVTLEKQISQTEARLSGAEKISARAQALFQRAQDRREYLKTPVQIPTGKDSPEALLARASQYATERDEAQTTAEQCRTKLESIEEHKRWLNTQLAAAEKDVHEQRTRINAELKARAQLENNRGAAESRLHSARAGLAALESNTTKIAKELEQAHAQLEQEITARQELEAGESQLDEVHEQAVAAKELIAKQHQQSQERQEALSAELAQLHARIEALELATAIGTDTQALLKKGISGVIGPVGETLTIVAGAEQQVAAVLGDLATAIAVQDLAVATELLAAGKQDLDLAIDHIAETHQQAAEQSPSELQTASVPDCASQTGCQAVSDLVSSTSAGINALMVSLLQGTYTAPDQEQAAQWAKDYPGYTFVSPDGSVFTARRVRRGGSAEAHRQASRTALAKARAKHKTMSAQLAQLRPKLEELAGALARAQVAEDEALKNLHASDAQFVANAEAVAAAQARVARLTEQREQTAERIIELQAQITVAQTAVESATEKLAQSHEHTLSEPDTARAEALKTELLELNETLLEARIALRSATDRVKFLADRVDALTRQARHVEQALTEAKRKSQRQAELALAAGRISELAQQVRRHSDERAETTRTDRTQVVEKRQEIRTKIDTGKTTLAQVNTALAKLKDAEHAANLARERFRLQTEELQRRARQELGLTPENLIEQFGPHLPVPQFDSAGHDDTDMNTRPFVRSEVEQIQRKAERDIAKIGKVNPLALEEYDALKERHDFLEKQIADIESSRKDLRGLVAEVDKHVKQVFSEAFADTQREFTKIFDRLFPGGHGELSLTDPDDMLTTGVEVTARPAGKKVKRLSLLSGGERSLVAVAMLVAIFKARPSPFYVMDEVEAALDDINLQRLLGLMQELQESSQLIVITHQQRTMEIADALYGVTMGTDGVSKVISQRLQRQ